MTLPAIRVVGVESGVKSALMNLDDGGALPLRPI